MTRRCRIMVVVFVAFQATRLAEGQRPGRENDWYPLGGIEALGDVVTDDKDPGVVVCSVFDAGLAAKGGLLVGDRIIAVNGKRLPDQADQMIAALAEGIEDSEAVKPSGKKTGLCKLTVLTAKGVKTVREVPVRYFGPHATTCPEKCTKCDAVLETTLAFLAKSQTDDGRFPMAMGSMNQQVVSVALGGLALAGDPKKRFAAQVGNAAEFVTKNAGKEESFGRDGKPGGANWNQTNWPLSFGTVFLSELAARQGGGRWKDGVTRMVGELMQNQELSGGWAHGPGGPNALKYLELEVMSNWALGGIGMAKRLGIKVDDGRVVKGVEYVKACTSGGGVSYSTRPGQIGHGDAGRTAGAYWAFRQLGRKERIVDEMGSYFERELKTLAAGHASPLMHVLAGGIASALRGKNAWKEYWLIHRPYIMASRTVDGAFDSRPTAESAELGTNADRGIGTFYLTPAYAIILQVGQGRYHLLDTVK